MNNSNNYSGNEIRINMGNWNDKGFFQISYLHFYSKSATTTYTNNLNLLYDSSISSGTSSGLLISSTNTPTLTFTFPVSFILNNIIRENSLLCG